MALGPMHRRRHLLRLWAWALAVLLLPVPVLAQAGGARDGAVDLRAAPARPGAAVNVFLSEAVGELASDAWYGEIVDPAAIAGQPAVIGRDRVVLSE